MALNNDSSGWHAFEGGTTLDQPGSESGVTIADEEHSSGARITLERGSRVAPFAITCGLYGWFFHTCYFSTEEEARQSFVEMKAELEHIISLLADSASDPANVKHAVLDAISKFVDRSPT